MGGITGMVFLRKFILYEEKYWKFKALDLQISINAKANEKAA